MCTLLHSSFELEQQSAKILRQYHQVILYSVYMYISDAQAPAAEVTYSINTWLLLYTETYRRIDLLIHLEQ
jgi:hypothetical protein